MHVVDHEVRSRFGSPRAGHLGFTVTAVVSPYSTTYDAFTFIALLMLYRTNYTVYSFQAGHTSP